MTAGKFRGLCAFCWVLVSMTVAMGAGEEAPSMVKGKLVEEIAKVETPVAQISSALTAATVETLQEAADALVRQIQDNSTNPQAIVAANDRLGVVLDELAKKGGERTKYDRYRSGLASSGPSAIDPTTWLVPKETLIEWAKNLALALGTLLVFKIIGGIVGRLVGRVASGSRLQVTELLKNFFVGTTKKVIFLMGLVIALSFLGIDIGPFLAAMGVAGFVIGFALQSTLSNFAAGIMILLYRPYELGNVINAAGVTGKVDAMNLVSTTMKTPDNQTIVVPNGSIWGGVITNITANETRRVDMVFGIGYDDDIEKASKLLQEIVTGHELVLKDPAPVIQLNELADSSVNFICRPWSKTSDYWAVYWDVTRTVKERFDTEGISIPFPQRDVHMHQVT